MCGLLQFSLYDSGDAIHNWEEDLAAALSDLKLTRGIAYPCVWQDCIKGKHYRGNRVTGTTSRLVEDDRRWNSSSK